MRASASGVGLGHLGRIDREEARIDVARDELVDPADQLADEHLEESLILRSRV